MEDVVSGGDIREKNMYLDNIETSKDGRFRTLSINWKNKKRIKEIMKKKGW